MALVLERLGSCFRGPMWLQPGEAAGSQHQRWPAQQRDSASAAPVGRRSHAPRPHGFRRAGYWMTGVLSLSSPRVAAAIARRHSQQEREQLIFKRFLMANLAWSMPIRFKRLRFQNSPWAPPFPDPQLSDFQSEGRCQVSVWDSIESIVCFGNPVWFAAFTTITLGNENDETSKARQTTFDGAGVLSLQSTPSWIGEAAPSMRRIIRPRAMFCPSLAR